MSSLRLQIANLLVRGLVPNAKITARRGFAAADNKARYGDLRASRGSANYELLSGLEQVRAKARFLARNSSSMTRFLQLLKVNTIGDTGFMFRCRVRKQDGSMDAQLNKRVQSAWAEWCKTPTVCGTMSMYDLEAQAVTTWGRDGEVFWEIVKGSKYGDNIAINPLEADYLEVGLNTVYPATNNRIVMGVEVDDHNKPQAYHFLTSHPGDRSWFSQQSGKYHRRIPASDVIHIYERLRPGQLRGEPPAKAVINAIKMVDGYREAETMSRRIRSAVMGFFRRDMPKEGGVSELATREEGGDKPELIMDLEPGRFKELPDGMSFDQFDPGGNQTDYAQFEAQIKTDIAMGFGISVMSHGMQTSGVSYSAGRTVIGEDRDFYKTLQKFFIDHGTSKVFLLWLSAQSLNVNSVIPPTRMQAIRTNFKFRGRGWDWVDPAKDVKSNAEALRTKQTSLSRVAATRGIELTDLLDEIEEDEAEAKMRGLTLDYNTANRVTKSNGEGEDEADDDDEK